jgi:hypothetical protein
LNIIKGRIWLESQEKAGSTFYTIPKKQMEKPNLNYKRFIWWVMKNLRSKLLGYFKKRTSSRNWDISRTKW